MEFPEDSEHLPYPYAGTIKPKYISPPTRTLSEEIGLGPLIASAISFVLTIFQDI